MSDYHLLLKSQMNDVFRAIQKEGFDPIEFKWEERDVGKQDILLIHRLIHEPSSYFFSFDISGVTYSPGLERRTETLGVRDWHSKLIKVPVWLRYLKREHEAPDLWGAEPSCNSAATRPTVTPRRASEDQSQPRIPRGRFSTNARLCHSNAERPVDWDGI
jgi:hypothetical protein